jgi:hypothetical protein
VDGGTHKAIARGLCPTHYQFARRHGGWRGRGAGRARKAPSTDQNGNRNRDDYDERFCALFLAELELRGSPHFPQSQWFGALARADDDHSVAIPFCPQSTSTVSLALEESNRARTELLLRESEARLRESEGRFSTGTMRLYVGWGWIVGKSSATTHRSWKYG